MDGEARFTQGAGPLGNDPADPMAQHLDRYPAMLLCRGYVSGHTLHPLLLTATYTPILPRCIDRHLLLRHHVGDTLPFKVLPHGDRQLTQAEELCRSFACAFLAFPGEPHMRLHLAEGEPGGLSRHTEPRNFFRKIFVD